jgi:hypothetical protein
MTGRTAAVPTPRSPATPTPRRHPGRPRALTPKEAVNLLIDSRDDETVDYTVAEIERR